MTGVEKVHFSKSTGSVFAISFFPIGRKEITVPALAGGINHVPEKIAHAHGVPAFRRDAD